MHESGQGIRAEKENRFHIKHLLLLEQHPEKQGKMKEPRPGGGSASEGCVLPRGREQPRNLRSDTPNPGNVCCGSEHLVFFPKISD